MVCGAGQGGMETVVKALVEGTQKKEQATMFQFRPQLNTPFIDDDDNDIEGHMMGESGGNRPYRPPGHLRDDRCPVEG